MKHRSFTEELARSRGDACRGEETLGIFVQARETSPVSASTCAEQASNVYGSFVYNTPICLRAGEQAPPPPSSEGAATWPSPAHPAARVPIRPDLSGQGGRKSSLASCSAATVTRPRIDPATRRKEGVPRLACSDSDAISTELAASSLSARPRNRAANVRKLLRILRTEFGKRCAMPRKDEMHWPERPQLRRIQTAFTGMIQPLLLAWPPHGRGDILPGYPQSQVTASRVGLL